MNKRGDMDKRKGWFLVGTPILIIIAVAMTFSFFDKDAFLSPNAILSTRDTAKLCSDDALQIQSIIEKQTDKRRGELKNRAQILNTITQCYNLEIDQGTLDLIETGMLDGGIAGSCFADFDDSGLVGSADLAELLASWGVCSGDCPADLSGDLLVNSFDMALLLSVWGDCTIVTTQCNDGEDNDDDGSTDLDDPGCLSGNDNVEYHIEGGPNTIHNFDFTVQTFPPGPDFADNEPGYIKELKWTNGFEVQKKVIWSELDRPNPYDGGERFYPNSIQHGNANVNGNSWIVTYANGNSAEQEHNEIDYNMIFTDLNGFIIEAIGDDLDVMNTYSFEGDVMNHQLEVTNKLQETIHVKMPVVVGGLMVGNFLYPPQLEGNEIINVANSGLSRLRASDGGKIESPLQDPSSDLVYPKINVFSPVSVLYDEDKLTIGTQYLTDLSEPQTAIINEKKIYGYHPAINHYLTIDLSPGETKTFDVAYSVTDGGGDWQTVLQPYKDWFYETYGPNPNYCPYGPFLYNVAVGNGYFYDTSIDRFYPGTTLRDMYFDHEYTNSLENLDLFNIDLYGAWRSTLNTAYLIDQSGNPDCNLGTSEMNESLCSTYEHGPNLELFDPNIDAFSNPQKINELAANFDSVGIDLFWFSRPCYDIVGADIVSNGEDYDFETGVPTQDIDLRVPANSQFMMSRLDHFLSRGVKGFYLDAFDCPGDDAFKNELISHAQKAYGTDLFIVQEGAIDKTAWEVPQIPIVKWPNAPYAEGHSQLLQWLTPQATFFGGKFNVALTEEETQEVLAMGYQPIYNGLGPNLEQGSEELGQYKDWACKGYVNRLERWNSYGQAMDCPVFEMPEFCCSEGYLGEPYC